LLALGLEEKFLRTRKKREERQKGAIEGFTHNSSLLVALNSFFTCCGVCSLKRNTQLEAKTLKKKVSLLPQERI